MIDRITPVILTLNEEPNIARTLESLTWAREVVIVDSHSADRTVEIANSFPMTRVVLRKFDSHSEQWNFAIHETGIDTEWILALDADYVLTDELIDELRSLDPGSEVAGYRASFQFCVFGTNLSGSVYPPVTVLYRRDLSRYLQDGHTQRIQVDGEVSDLRSPIMHDDRKPVSSWLPSQGRYMKLECEVIRNTPWGETNWPDRVRKLRVAAPFAIFLYCLILKGAILQGRSGWFYAFQRMTAELVLSLELLYGDLEKVVDRANPE